MGVKWLTVPLNEQGKIDENYGKQHTPNLAEFILDESEFDSLWDNDVFKLINSRCNLLIDDYESEEISADNLRKCIDIIELVPGKFREAALLAIEKDTYLALDF